MLQNAYFVAKIGADTAENERNFAKILPKIGNYPTRPGPRPALGAARRAGAAGGAGPLRHALLPGGRTPPPRRRRPDRIRRRSADP